MPTNHPQDDLLMLEALIYHSHDLRDRGEPERAVRAWELAEEIAAEHGLGLTDAIMQIDDRQRRNRADARRELSSSIDQ